MNLFTVNQVNQVYVVNDVAGSEDAFVKSSPGTLAIMRQSAHELSGALRFQYRGAGGVISTDDIKNVMRISATKASDMATPLKSALITLNPSFLDANSNVGPVGQDFLLRLSFTNYIGISVEDSTYWKYGLVHVVANMTESDFYEKLAISLVKNMSREATTLVKVTLVGESQKQEVDNSYKFKGAGPYTGIVISEVEPDWVLGLKQQKILHFEATPTTVSVLNSNGTYDDLVWGNVSYTDGKELVGGDTVANVTVGNTVPEILKKYEDYIPNGKLAADYEYFFHGERGDQYRKAGWPDYIPTEYLVDPTAEYDFIQIHYAYVGPNEGVQKSEKDMTLLVKRSATDEAGSLSSLANLIDTHIRSFVTSELTESPLNLM